MTSNPDTPAVGPITCRKHARLHGLITTTDGSGNTIRNDKGKPVMYAACPAGTRGLGNHRKAIPDKIKQVNPDCADRVCHNPACRRVLAALFDQVIHAYTKTGNPDYTTAGYNYLRNLDWDLFATSADKAESARLAADLRDNPPAALVAITV
jgi:hypothetical protein